MATTGSATTEAGSGAPQSGRAFGLSIEADYPVVGLGPAPDGVPGRRVELRQTTAADLERAWRRPDRTVVTERRFPDGRLFLQIDHHAELGYRIYAPRFGRYSVSADGTLIYAALPQVAAWRHARLLFAQVLPLAATLQGLEPLHASAVALDGRGIAFVGHSGAGKTSVVTHLTSAGAALLTDDVLSLDVEDGVVRAHPGAAFSNLDDSLVQLLTPIERERLGPLIGRSDKLHVEAKVDTEPRSLAALYFLQRPAEIPTLTFEPIEAPSPGLLMGSAFIPYVRTSLRAVTQLTICAALASSVAVFRARVPSSVGSKEFAEGVRAHVRGTLEASSA